MKKLKENYFKRSRLTLWLFSQGWSTSYSRATSCQVPWDFPLWNGHEDTKNSLFRKQLTYFNIYIAGSYFHICFILIVNYDIKHTRRSSHCEVLIHKILIVKVDLKFNQKPRKINVTDVLLHSVARTILIIWNTFSCSNKLFPLRWAYPC